MIRITYRRIIGHLWRIKSVTDPAGNPMKFDRTWLKKEIFHRVKVFPFGLVWFYDCSHDEQGWSI